MKYFIAIALIATVASAAIVKPTLVSAELAEIQEIIAAINSPSTNPATAAALEQMLFDVLGVNPEPVAVGPAIIDAEPIAVGPAIIDAESAEVEPISVGPAIVDFPMPDGGVVAEESVIAPSPVVIAPAPVAEAAASTPLVQIILNINQATAESAPVAPVPILPAPVVAPEAIKPEPVQVVESAPEPVAVAEPAPIPPMPVHPIGVVAPEPVQVIEAAPVPVEPVVIGTPILPSPAVVLPETLN